MKRPLIAHISLFTAEAFWGLMAPLGKDAMTHGITGLDLVSMRVLGGAILFWITSLFMPKEKVPPRDLIKLIGAGILGLVTNQCCYTIGLSITSPVNASIVTTSLPIFAMILAAIFMKEPITGKKATGVAIGCIGAVILIVTSAASGNSKVGNIWGDLMCMGAQLSFALYLALFSKMIRKYSVITVTKWMFTYATILILPFTANHLTQIDYMAVPISTWWETAFVVFMGTYVAYLLMMVAQNTLRPTVVSIYNYVQPVVAVTVSLITGLSIFKPTQAVAVILVFSGVWLVIKSKSRGDIERAKQANDK